MKKKLEYIMVISFSVLLLFAGTTMLMAQESADESTEIEDGLKPQRPAFESSWIIDNQTASMYSKGSFEFMIQHRFGTIDNGIKDLWGLYAPSNIRLGLSYTISDNFGIGSIKGPLSVGIGTTKNDFIQDVNVKYGLFTQNRSGSMPVTITYFFDMAIETAKPTESLPNGNESDRLSYFHQILIARRFSPKISIQIAPSLTHYNTAPANRENDHFAISLSGRYKFSPQSAILIGIDQPITKHTTGNPQPNLSFGIEVATSAHAFQIFMTNYSAIVPQKNNYYNQNDYQEGEFVIGFNITRLWNF